MNPSKLINRLHSVFDKEAGRLWVLDINTDGSSFSWTLDSDTLVITPVGGTASPLSIDLDQYTCNELNTLINAQAGYSIAYFDSSVSKLSSKILIDGNGDTAVTITDSKLYGATSLLWVYLDALWRELEQAGVQIVQMINQLVVTQSEGEWADVWGSYYAIYRKSGESDNEYTTRIIYETLRAKVNHLALENILENDLGDTVSIIEPWKQIFVTNKSNLNSTHHLYDGNFYAYCTIEIASSFPKALLQPIVEKNKAAGIRVWYREQVDISPIYVSPDVPVSHHEIHFPKVNFDQSGYLILNEGPPLSGHRTQWSDVQFLIGGILDAREYRYELAGDIVNPLYDQSGNPYDGFTSNYFPFPVYQLGEPGAGVTTKPLLSGSQWPIPLLQNANYKAFHDEVDLTEVSLTLINDTVIDIVQVTVDTLWTDAGNILITDSDELLTTD